MSGVGGHGSPQVYLGLNLGLGLGSSRLIAASGRYDGVAHQTLYHAGSRSERGMSRVLVFLKWSYSSDGPCAARP